MNLEQTCEFQINVVSQYQLLLIVSEKLLDISTRKYFLNHFFFEKRFGASISTGNTFKCGGNTIN